MSNRHCLSVGRLSSSGRYCEGVPVKIAQQQLGHASIETTFNVYTHVVDDAHWNAICNLERLLVPNGPKYDSSSASGETVD